MTRHCLAFCLALSIYVCAPAAFAVVVSYHADMNGATESPATPSTGTAFGTVIYNDATHTLTLNVAFSGLVNEVGVDGKTGVSASHIHAATASPFSGNAGVATTTPTFAGFPSEVLEGSFSNVLDLTQSSSWNPAYITANGGTTTTAEAAFAAAMAGGQAYWNIHSHKYTSGEIRGFLAPGIPEPTSGVLISLAVVLGGCAGRSRRTRR